MKFVAVLPENARIVNTEEKPAHPNKEEVKSQLRANPGQWADVYDGYGRDGQVNEATERKWRGVGFETSLSLDPSSKTDAEGKPVLRPQWRYKLFVRYVGVDEQPEAEPPAQTTPPPPWPTAAYNEAAEPIYGNPGQMV